MRSFKVSKFNEPPVEVLADTVRVTSQGILQFFVRGPSTALHRDRLVRAFNAPAWAEFEAGAPVPGLPVDEDDPEENDNGNS